MKSAKAMHPIELSLAFALTCPVALLAILIFWEFSALVLLFGLGACCAARFWTQ